MIMMRYVSNFLLLCNCAWSNAVIKGDDDQQESSSDRPDTRAATGAKGSGRRRPRGFRFEDPVSQIMGLFFH